jgi:hypothetical protein
MGNDLVFDFFVKRLRNDLFGDQIALGAIRATSDDLLRIG